MDTDLVQDAIQHGSENTKQNASPAAAITDQSPVAAIPHASQVSSVSPASLTALSALATLSACGGGSSGTTTAISGSINNPVTELPPVTSSPPSSRDAARFLTQTSFGIRSPDEIEQVRSNGFERWIADQFNKSTDSHLAYLEQQRLRESNQRATEEMSYEAIWQQWLTSDAQLRARMSWALLQLFVISNIAPDIRPYAMSSYMDMLNRNAFGNYRQLLEDVSLHPAMGYYLNMQGSEKEDATSGIHPNENYAREVLQLFSIGLVKLNQDGSQQTDSAGVAMASYDERVVKGFAKAFTGWSFGALDNNKPAQFHDYNPDDNNLWIVPMKAWPGFHSPDSKTLLNGRSLPAGQTPEQDMKDALDNIFNHPNVGPFVGKQLIQRLVTSNPSTAYISRVASVFNNNGSGVRGDLRAVLRAILLDPEARGDNAASQARFGKQREPVIRFANFLRGLGAKSKNGFNNIHYLDSADDALGQSPLLAPSVFNFYAPAYRPAGPLTVAGMAAPEFQITSETTIVGSLNFFASLFNSGGYGWGDSRLEFDYTPLKTLASDASKLIDRIDLLFFNQQMSASSRDRFTRMIGAISVKSPEQRVQAALTLTALSADFVIQK